MIATTTSINSTYDDLPNNWKQMKWEPNTSTSEIDCVTKTNISESTGNIFIQLADCYLNTSCEGLFDLDVEVFKDVMTTNNINLSNFFQKIWTNEKKLPPRISWEVTQKTVQMVCWLFQHSKDIPQKTNLVQHIVKNRRLLQPTSYEVDFEGNIFIVINAIIERGTSKKAKIVVDFLGLLNSQLEKRDLTTLKVCYSTTLYDPRYCTTVELQKQFEFAKIRQKQFYNEIVVLNSLQRKDLILEKFHENIYKTNSGKDVASFVVEYCNNTDLYNFASKEEHLTDKNLFKIFSDCLYALKWIEQNNVRHQDIKPENFLVNMDEEGNLSIKLADFGNARFGEDEVVKLSGSYEFMSPSKVTAFLELYSLLEQLTHKHERIQFLKRIFLSEKHDIWSLGMLFFSLLTNNSTIWGNDQFHNTENQLSNLRKIASLSQQNVDNLLSAEIPSNSIWNLIIKMLRTNVDEIPSIYECIDIFLQLRNDGMVFPHLARTDL